MHAGRGMTLRVSPRASVMLTVACLIATAGCGRPSSIALAPCSGVVTLDGKPLEGWYVSFHPDAERSTRGPASMGLTDAAGVFRMWAAGKRDGAVVGQHRVFLSPPGGDLPPVEVSAAAAAANVPASYRKPETSGLMAMVEPDRRNQFKFSLRSTAK